MIIDIDHLYTLQSLRNVVKAEVRQSARSAAQRFRKAPDCPHTVPVSTRQTNLRPNLDHECALMSVPTSGAFKSTEFNLRTLDVQISCYCQSVTNRQTQLISG